MVKNIIIFFINLLILTVNCTENDDKKPSTTILPSSSQTTVPPSPTSVQPMLNNEDLLGEKPINKPLEALTELPIDEEEPTKPNRLITFDQRQEGQYNIRADLENFMIVVIPPNPSAGVNLLDLLTRSALKRSSPKQTKLKQNYYSDKLQRPFGMQKNSNLPNNNYLSRFSQQYPSITSLSSLDNSKEYIEGRTPYRVDISSNAGENDSGAKVYQSPDGQIDVIPPPYPQNYQHLIKPYHLEVEPVVHHLPPVQQQQQQQQFPNIQQTGIFDFLNRARFAKSIKDSSINGLNKNLLTNSDEINRFNGKRNIEYYPYYLGINNNNDFLNPSSYNNIMNFDEYDKEYDSDGSNWELKLIGATEQCGPDRVRDSYGVCQFIKNI